MGHDVSSIVCGVMDKRRDGYVHTVMFLQVIFDPDYHTRAHVLYEATDGRHTVPIAEFVQTFEPLEPFPPPSAWERLMAD